MTDSVAGVVLAAGAGTRLHPLTLERPKALCPFGAATLVDRAVGQLAQVSPAIAVNAHHGAAALVSYLGGRIHVSVEEELLGTGGAIGRLRSWIDGRDVVIANADTVHDVALAAVVEEWDRERIGFVTAEAHPTSLASGMRLVAALMPWTVVREIPESPHGLYPRWWAPAAATGDVVVIAGGATGWFDCGRVIDYLAANLWQSSGASVVGEGARVDGVIEQSVIWPGAVVRTGESLHRAIRTTAGRTVLVR
jgi:MurNAc alpha-1-phosphate uridylyltransferase